MDDSTAKRRAPAAARTRSTRALASLTLPALMLPAWGLAACATPRATRTPLDLSTADWNATGAGAARAVMVRTPAAKAVTLEEAADQLADADVVFLGEQHDNSAGHAVQLALTKALAERRGKIILSMEMLERDAQPRVDLYLRGALDEQQFREHTRLWPNYDEHYRGAVEYCRAEGHAVLAANVYRPIAAQVAKEGLSAGSGDAWAAREVSAPSTGEYRRRFNEVMGGHGDHGDQGQLDRIFAAQCIKDDTMAESMARAIRAAREARAAEDDGSEEPMPQVVHWNGRFHSDYGLGTVERLKARVPGLNVAVVSMLEVERFSAELTEDELNQGHFLVLVRPE